MAYDSRFKREDIDELFKAILLLKDEEDCYRFFEDICTINEIHAMAGEFNFSDCGKIEKVKYVSENTYKLWMQKETETDFTNLDENDVLMSIVNNLRTGGTDYYTSWFRCLTKNVNDNTLTVYIKRLREKIEDNPQEPELIKTVRGIGYRVAD